MSLGELLEWACLNGARFLGKDSVLGTLEPGKKSGVVRITGIVDGKLTPSAKSIRL